MAAPVLEDFGTLVFLVLVELVGCCAGEMSKESSPVAREFELIADELDSGGLCLEPIAFDAAGSSLDLDEVPAVFRVNRAVLEAIVAALLVT